MSALAYSHSIRLSTHVRGKPRQQSVWEIRYRLPNGTDSTKTIGKAWTKQSRPASGFLTKAQAEVAAEAFLNGRINAPPEQRRTLREACIAFVDDKRDDNKRGSSTRGYASVANVVCAWPWRNTAQSWGEQPLESITAIDIAAQRKVLKAKRSPSTLNHYHHIIRGAFGAESPKAQAWERASEQPASADDVQYYTKAQFKTLLANCQSDQERAIYIVAGQTGARRSEQVGLYRHMVDFEAKKIRFAKGWTRGSLHEKPDSGGFDGTKGHQMRSVDMTSTVMAALTPYVQMLPAYDGDGEPLLVFSRDGDGRVPLDPDSITKRFEKTRKRAGLPRITFHDLRHTFATAAMASGEVPVGKLQELLGHQHLSTTQRYVHFAPDPKTQAALSNIWDDDEDEGQDGQIIQFPVAS